MAVCVIKNTAQLGPRFILTPERYHPKRRMALGEGDGGVALSQLVTLENDIVSCKKADSVWLQINTSDALGGYLRFPPRPEPLHSNKKRLAPGDVIISRLRPYLRQVAYVDQAAPGPLCASTEFYVLRGRDPGSIAFLVPFLLSDAAQTVFANAVEGSQHPRFKEEDLLSLVVPRPLLEAREELSRAMEESIGHYRAYERAMAGVLHRVNGLIPV